MTKTLKSAPPTIQHNAITPEAEITQALRNLSLWIFDKNKTALTYENLVHIHCGILAAGLLPNCLPEKVAVQTKKQFLKLQARDLAQQQALLSLAQLFEENKIPFCPIKGADLAARIYPHGALRPRGDLDILIPEKERKRTVNLLQKAGWTQPYRYANDNHESDMFRNGICLELHHKLPNFKAKDMEEVWQNMIESAPYCHHLSLEFNMLMLFQHSAIHRWINATTLLMDYGFLLKKEGIPVWQKIHAMAQKMHLYDPALFLRSFPEFFPADKMPEEEFSPDVCQDFRRMLFPQVPLLTPHEQTMRDINRFSLLWWRDRLSGLRPSVIRFMTRNPHGHYGKLCIDYLQINGQKFFTFLQGMQKIKVGELSVYNSTEKKIRKILLSTAKKSE